MFVLPGPAGGLYKQAVDDINDATVTKVVAVMLFHDSENAKEPNVGKLRRSIRKLRDQIAAPHLKGRVHPKVREWIEATCTFV